MEGDQCLSGPKTSEEAEQVFQKMYCRHFDALMTQLIKSYGLSLSWLDVLSPLVMEATQTVRTDVFAKDVMDINEYVRVKKIPCGERTDSSFTYGVVCSKNVTHKKMQTEITNPTILLLKCAFDFQRRENQLSSFDTLHLQEHKYLNNLVDKVKAFRPSIILVQKSVSRLALEDLFNLGIVVAVNVKPSVMLRVARCTRAEIMTSLDQLFFNVRLGTCGKFWLHNFTFESGIKKTLMYFDVCEPRLGCVITLRGGTNRELKKVKKVAQFGLHLAYNSFLESSFLLDEFAWPGKLQGSIVGEDEGVCLTSEPYSSSSSTPEIPLYPSLAHPLSSLSPSELVKRLEALGLCGTSERDAPTTGQTSRGEEGEERRVSFPPQLGGDTTEALQDFGFEIVTLEQVSGRSDIDGEVENERIVIAGPTDPKIGTTSPAQVDSHTDGKDEDGHDFQSDSHADVDKPRTELTEDDNSTDSPGKMEGREQALTQFDSNISFQDPVSKLKSVGVDILSNLGETEFNAALKRRLISVSPRVKFHVPYLQTAAGREADVRQYLSCVIYWSVQFIPKLQATLPPKRVSGESDGEEERDAEDTVLEMGLTKTLVKDSIFPKESDGDSRNHNQIRSQTSFQTCLQQPSYKSISEHPLTSSFLLLRANTNEMQAALADFRARAGVESEDNLFFFKTAKNATDYRFLLQNVFNKYKQFEIELDEVEEEGREEVARGKRRKRKSNWWRKKVREERSKERGEREVTPTEDMPGSTRQSHDLSDTDDDSEVGGSLKLEDVQNGRQEEEDEETIKDEEAGTRSREHTPALARSGRGGQEVGIMFGSGTLEDMDHAHTPSRSTGKDAGQSSRNSSLDISYSDTWLALHQVCVYADTSLYTSTYFYQ